MPCPSHPRRSASSLFIGISLASLAACGGGAEVVPAVDGVIDRETFIAVYVDLRAEAVRSPELELSPEAREQILAGHAVDEESLIAFVDAYGRELEYMNELWAEVERRIEALPPGTPDQDASGA